MVKSVQVFISYRRQGGYTLARLVWQHLNRLGFCVFMDVEDLRSGPFDEALHRHVKSASDVILILSANGLDRCRHNNDWLRTEIGSALKQGKNIVPLLAQDFSWSIAELPEELSVLPRLQNVQVSHDFFDASMNKLVDMLVSKPVNLSRRSWVRKVIILIAAVMTVVGLFSGLAGWRVMRNRVDVAQQPVSLELSARLLSDHQPLTEQSPVAIKSVLGAVSTNILCQAMQAGPKVVSQDIDIELSTADGRTLYREGDRVQYRIRLASDAHLAVFCHQSDGHTVQLFPNAWNRTTLVKAGEVVELPGSQMSGFEIVVGPPFGVDVVEVVACSASSSLHAFSMKRVSPGIAVLPLLSRGMVVQEVKESVNRFSRDDETPEWGVARLSITTEPMQ